MSVPQIILLAWFAFSAVCTILIIGKDRTPTTPGSAVFSVCMLSLLAFLVVIA